MTHSDDVCEVAKVAAEFRPGAKLELNTRVCCAVEISLKNNIDRGMVRAHGISDSKVEV